MFALLGTHKHVSLIVLYPIVFVASALCGAVQESAWKNPGDDDCKLHGFASCFVTMGRGWGCDPLLTRHDQAFNVLFLSQPCSSSLNPKDEEPLQRRPSLGWGWWWPRAYMLRHGHCHARCRKEQENCGVFCSSSEAGDPRTSRLHLTLMITLWKPSQASDCSRFIHFWRERKAYKHYLIFHRTPSSKRKR